MKKIGASFVSKPKSIGMKNCGRGSAVICGKRQ